MGGTLMDAVIAIQEVALVCPKSADIVQAGNFGPIRTFAEYATPEQKARFLPDLLAGRKLISLGMTEPDAGSAVTELAHHRHAATATAASIDGTKIFSTHSPEAALFLVYVRFGPGVGGIGSVLVEKRHAGLHRRQAVEVHERRAVVAALFRELPHSGGQRAARRGRLQEADRRLQRRAARQCRRARWRSAATPTTSRASTR